MAKYTPAANNPLLSTAAQALSVEQMEMMVTLAEDVLGLTGTNYTGSQAISAQNAVALQISYVLAIPPEAQFLTSKGRGARSEAYRTGISLMISSQAAAIVANLANDAVGSPNGKYVSMQSYRGRPLPYPGSVEPVILEGEEHIQP